MSSFHRASLKMAWLRICRITNESTETDFCLLKLKHRVALAVELGIYIYTIRWTSRDIAIKQRKINNIKIKIISFIIYF